MKLKTSLLVLTVSTSSLFAVGFTDTFDSIDPDWVQDRYNPAGFNSVLFGGDNRLQIDISTADSAANRPAPYSSVFYSTQGKKRESAISGSWSLSGDLHISDDLLDQTNLRRTDLWARTTADVEANADYPIFGVARTTVNAPAVWRVWDGEIGWINLANAVTGGWNNLSIVADATSYSYYLNGTLVYTDLTTTTPQEFTTAFVQAFNFGDEDYSVHWDNINLSAAAVPEVGSTLALLGVSALTLGAFARRRSA